MILDRIELPSVYIETSVVSYLVARISSNLVSAAHQQVTLEWWEKILPKCRGYISTLVLEEAELGDPDAAERRLNKLRQFPILDVTGEINALAEEYFVKSRLPEKAIVDALHLATASVHEMDYMISWNFAHILAAPVRRIVQEINTQKGIRTPVICTPEELMEV